jgi:hypothetical protein
MLVASSPIVPDRPFRADPSGSLRLSPWSVFQCLSAFRTGKAATGKFKPALGPVRRLVRLRRAIPTTWRFRSFRCFRTSCRPLRDTCLPCLPDRHRPCRNRTCDALSGPRRFDQRLRASRNIYGSLGPFRRNRQACFPTLLRASLPLLPVRTSLHLSGAYSRETGEIGASHSGAPCAWSLGSPHGVFVATRINASWPAAAFSSMGPVARNGLSLACNGSRFHGLHSRVNVPGLLLRFLLGCFQARSAFGSATGSGSPRSRRLLRFCPLPVRALARSALPPASTPLRDSYLPLDQSVLPGECQSARLPVAPDFLSLPASASIASCRIGSTFQVRELKHNKAGVSSSTSLDPRVQLYSLPATLRMLGLSPILSYS